MYHRCLIISLVVKVWWTWSFLNFLWRKLKVHSFMLSMVVHVYSSHYRGGWGKKIALAQEFTSWDKRVRSHLKSNYYHNNQNNPSQNKLLLLLQELSYVIHISHTKYITMHPHLHTQKPLRNNDRPFSVLLSCFSFSKWRECFLSR